MTSLPFGVVLPRWNSPGQRQALSSRPLRSSAERSVSWSVGGRSHDRFFPPSRMSGSAENIAFREENFFELTFEETILTQRIPRSSNVGSVMKLRINESHSRLPPDIWQQKVIGEATDVFTRSHKNELYVSFFFLFSSIFLGNQSKSSHNMSGTP